MAIKSGEKISESKIFESIFTFAFMFDFFGVLSVSQHITELTQSTQMVKPDSETVEQLDKLICRLGILGDSLNTMMPSLKKQEHPSSVSYTARGSDHTRNYM